MLPFPSSGWEVSSHLCFSSVLTKTVQGVGMHPALLGQAVQPCFLPWALGPNFPVWKSPPGSVSQGTWLHHAFAKSALELMETVTSLPSRTGPQDTPTFLPCRTCFAEIIQKQSPVCVCIYMYFLASPLQRLGHANGSMLIMKDDRLLTGVSDWTWISFVELIPIHFPSLDAVVNKYKIANDTIAWGFKKLLLVYRNRIKFSTLVIVLLLYWINLSLQLLLWLFDDYLKFSMYMIKHAFPNKKINFIS